MSPQPPKRVLIVGEGGGTLPVAIQGLLPNAKIDVVEIDVAVDRVAKRFFNYKPNANTKITIQDGRVFIKRARKAPPYDLIMLDAFAEDYIPEHMLTQEFLREVDAILAPGGVLAANTWSSSDLYDHESATYTSVFGPFLNLKGDNRIIMVRKGGLPSQAELVRNAPVWEQAFAKHGANQAELIPLMSRQVDWDRQSRILTDQYSPSNVLNAQGRRKR
jgi:spermidine synthase